MGLIKQFIFFVLCPPGFLLWKIFNFYIRAMSFMVKAFFGMIAAFLKAITRGALWPEKVALVFYKQGISNIKKSKPLKKQNNGGNRNKRGNQNQEESGGSSITSALGAFKIRYLFLFVAIAWLFPVVGYSQLVNGLVNNPSQFLSFVGALQLFARIVFAFVPAIATVVISALFKEFLGDGVFFWHASKALEKAGHIGAGAASTAAAGAASAMGNAAPSGASMGESALTTASHIQTAGDMAMEGVGEEGLGSLLEGSMFEGAAASASSIGIILVIAFVIYTLIAGVVSLILVGLTFYWASGFLPMVLGPISNALGVGGAYANLFGDEVANSEAGLSIMSGDAFAPQMRAANQAFAKLGCMAKGPQCYRQWQMNNTVRPGSEARGETYELQIAQFGLGTDRVDVAYKEAEYTLPVNFLVENTRNGLKGINARNVSYNIAVKDREETYCSTGWNKISSFDDERNYILPGLGVSPTDSLEELNLGDCGLLQPSMGDNLVMELQVRYNYASQATLYVDAMSREYRREQGIEPGFKKSETAKTPVQSYINVNSPITFYETEGGDRNAVPFAARFGFETPGFNSKYRIDPDSIQIVDSSVTMNTDTCNGLERDEDKGDNYYEISDEAKERINLRQNDSWFSADVEPAPLRCTMKIKEEDLGQISPTGEQLVMRIDGNYTILKQDKMTGFDVTNTLCTRHNCPMLVTEEYAEESPYDLHSKCSTDITVDARDGCSVRNPEEGDSGWRTPNVVEGLTIEEGETARSAGNYVDGLDLPFSITHKDKSNMNLDDSTPISAPELSRRQERSAGAVLYQKGEQRSLEIETLNAKLCREETEKDSVDDLSQASQKYMQEWQNKQDGEKSPIALSVNTISCEEPLKEKIKQVYACEFGLLSEGIQGYVDFYADLYTMNFDELGDIESEIPDSCRQLDRNPLSCDGVLVERSNNVRCYGGEFGE